MSGAVASQYEVKETGTYKAMVTTKDGCVIVSDEISFIINGIEGKNSDVRLYPNPTSDYLNIANIPAQVKVSLYDAQGREVNSAPVEAGKDGITIDMRSLVKGMYLVNLRDQNQVLRIKVIKQ